MAPLRSLSEILQSSNLIDGDNSINESFKITYDLLKTYVTSLNQLVDTLSLTNPNTESNYTEAEIRAGLQVYSQGDFANLDNVDKEAATNPTSLNKVSLPYVDPDNYTLHIDLSANTWSLIYDKTNVNHAILSGAITTNDTFLEGFPILENAMIEFPVSQFGATGVKTVDTTTGEGITGFNTTIRPSMRITASQVDSGATSNDATLSLTFTSSEATTDFVVGDITVTNGTLSNFASTSSTVYTATFTPSGDGNCTISVAENVFNDTAGNGNTESAQFTWTSDTTAPDYDVTEPIGTFVFNITTPIANRIIDKRPTLVINTDEAGTLRTNIATGFNSGASLSVNVGDNTIQLAELQYGTYSGKTLTLTDSANNSKTVTIPTFEVLGPQLTVTSGLRLKRK